MKIIAFEGLDKAGKHTLARYYVDYLISQGYKVGFMDFHRYSTPTGKIIKDWLYGEYDADQETIELIMAADKLAAKQDIEFLRSEGYDFLILDRYKWSQYAYSLASGYPKDKAGYLNDMIPSPDFTVYVHVTPETSMSRRGKHGDNDRYESDLHLLYRVRDNYNRLATIHNDTTLVIEGEQPLEMMKSEFMMKIKQRGLG